MMRRFPASTGTELQRLDLPLLLCSIIRFKLKGIMIFSISADAISVVTSSSQFHRLLAQNGTLLQNRGAEMSTKL